MHFGLHYTLYYTHGSAKYVCGKGERVVWKWLRDVACSLLQSDGVFQIESPQQPLSDQMSLSQDRRQWHDYCWTPFILHDGIRCRLGVLSPIFVPVDHVGRTCFNEEYSGLKLMKLCILVYKTLENLEATYQGQTLRGHGLSTEDVKGEDLDALFAAMRRAVPRHSFNECCPNAKGRSNILNHFDTFCTWGVARRPLCCGHQKKHVPRSLSSATV